MKHRKMTNKRMKQMMHDIGMDDSLENNENLVDNQADEEGFSPPDSEENAK